jgi:hypothetical protein
VSDDHPIEYPPAVEGIPYTRAWKDGRRIYVISGCKPKLSDALWAAGFTWDRDLKAHYVGTGRPGLAKLEQVLPAIREAEAAAQEAARALPVARYRLRYWAGGDAFRSGADILLDRGGVLRAAGRWGHDPLWTSETGYEPRPGYPNPEATGRAGALEDAAAFLASVGVTGEWAPDGPDEWVLDGPLADPGELLPCEFSLHDSLNPLACIADRLRRWGYDADIDPELGAVITPAGAWGAEFTGITGTPSGDAFNHWAYAEAPLRFKYRDRSPETREDRAVNDEGAGK